MSHLDRKYEDEVFARIVKFEVESDKFIKNREALGRIIDFVRNFAPKASPESVCRWIDYGYADSAPPFWTADPIDGTKVFYAGINTPLLWRW